MDFRREKDPSWGLRKREKVGLGCEGLEGLKEK